MMLWPAASSASAFLQRLVDAEERNNPEMGFLAKSGAHDEAG